jgi:hypothetical protein
MGKPHGYDCVGGLWAILENCNLEKMQHVMKKANEHCKKMQGQKHNAKKQTKNAKKMQGQKHNATKNK